MTIDRALGETHRIEAAGQRQAAQHHLADLDLGRDDDVDRHVVGGEQIAPVWLRDRLWARMRAILVGTLNSEWATWQATMFDFVVEGDGDDHVGLLGAGLGKHVGMGAVADEAAHVERIADRLDKLRRGIDHRNVVVFGRQPLGNAVADLACAANQDSHRWSPVSLLAP